MSAQTPRICVVGAGMSGILMGIRLLQKGYREFRIYEKAASVGGTWRENTYPGLTCDVPSYFYSYSFEQNVEWSHRFSPGPEIRAYFEGVAEKYGVMPYVSLGEKVTSARYVGGEWQVETSRGEKSSFDVLVSATGPLHQWKLPDIEGLEHFEGACFHSADWQHDVKLEGRRIGVVGTGSTAVQMMAPLSELASQLTMFQRTAQWIMPVGNKEYTPVERSRARRFPLLPWIARTYYKRAFESFSAGVVKDGRLRKVISDRCRRHLDRVKDPELRKKLTPDYEPMCKRLIMSNNFYPTLAREHVHLETEGIDHIEARGVVTLDGHLHELDVLVLATGFDAHAWGIDEVVGEDGRSLKQAWSDGTRAYRSVAMPGFPNFFMLVGPNSPIGNISLIDVSEVQADYVLKCIDLLRRGKARSIVPNAEATRAFHATLLDAMQGTVWVTGCDSWYLDEDGVPITWPWTAKRFHRDMRKPNFAEFDLQPA